MANNVDFVSPQCCLFKRLQVWIMSWSNNTFGCKIDKVHSISMFCLLLSNQQVLLAGKKRRKYLWIDTPDWWITGWFVKSAWHLIWGWSTWQSWLSAGQQRGGEFDWWRLWLVFGNHLRGKGTLHIEASSSSCGLHLLELRTSVWMLWYQN